MNAKNLPLKFALTALLVAVCVWSLLWGNGLKQGIDLKGGHSLVFEFKTTKDDPGDLANTIIDVLKKRVDPRGLRSLEWRPLGKNRIEVRMPAGNPEGQERKREYQRELTRLVDLNVSDPEILRVTQTPAGPARQAVIAKIAAIGDDAQGQPIIDTQIQELLTKLGAAADEAKAAQSRLEMPVAEAQTRLTQAQSDLAAAKTALDAARTRAEALADRDEQDKERLAAFAARKVANTRYERAVGEAKMARAVLELAKARAASAQAEKAVAPAEQKVVAAEAAVQAAEKALAQTPTQPADNAARKAAQDRLAAAKKALDEVSPPAKPPVPPVTPPPRPSRTLARTYRCSSTSTTRTSTTGSPAPASSPGSSSRSCGSTSPRMKPRPSARWTRTAATAKSSAATKPSRKGWTG